MIDLNYTNSVDLLNNLRCDSLPENTPHIDPEQLNAIARGSQDAFAVLFNRWKHRVYTIAKTYTENQVRSEEIVQDVFLRIWKHRQKLPGIQQLDAWIYQIARNHSLNVLKQMARDRQFHAVELSYLPEWKEAAADRVEVTDLQNLLQEALNLLSPQQRRVFELCRLEGQPREAVALQMGIAKATVSVHLTIALRIVRSYLVSRLYLAIALAPLSLFFKISQKQLITFLEMTVFL